MYLTFEPHDPILVRDGRPFGKEAGNRANTQEWIPPSVNAGAVRTWIGHLELRPGERFTAELAGELRQVGVAGPFLLRGIDDADQLFLPVPEDALFFDDEDDLRVVPLYPRALRDGEGCDLPDGLWPLMGGEAKKPAKKPAFWSMDRMVEWLSDQPGPPMRIVRHCKHLADRPQVETRVHVAIDRGSRTSSDGDLFMTNALDLRKMKLSVRVEPHTPTLSSSVQELVDRYRPLGGERRLTRLAEGDGALWELPVALRLALDGCQFLRMILVTPAIFAQGWKPGWIGDEGIGQPPSSPDLQLRLRAASVPRFRSISGWDLEHGRPKPTRRMAFSGSVYYFEVLKGNPGAYTSDMWLRAVSDDEQDRRDGFGLAVWGAWRQREHEGERA